MTKISRAHGLPIYLSRSWGWGGGKQTLFVNSRTDEKMADKGAKEPSCLVLDASLKEALSELYMMMTLDIFQQAMGIYSLFTTSTTH